MEEAFKMRNLLQEFLKKHGVRKPTILGVREHIFTGRYDEPGTEGSILLFISRFLIFSRILTFTLYSCSVSSLAWFMSNQENSFVTIGQRLLANPLK